MASAEITPAQPSGATGVLLLADGTALWGIGCGAEGSAVGEVCFNTSMTGYQEVMTDPSYAGQIVTFTFPHIGNVGANPEDIESKVESALGCIMREIPTGPSNFRSTLDLDTWLKDEGKIGLAGVDTRELTRLIRLNGAPNAVIAHSADGVFDLDALLQKAREWPGLEGMDLARRVSRKAHEGWRGGAWELGKGYGESAASKPHVVAIDYGAKDNIFRQLVRAGARVTVVPAETSLEDVLAHEPDGVFLSNGPGDPEPCDYAIKAIAELLETACRPEISDDDFLHLVEEAQRLIARMTRNQVALMLGNALARFLERPPAQELARRIERRRLFPHLKRLAYAVMARDGDTAVRAMRELSSLNAALILRQGDAVAQR